MKNFFFFFALHSSLDDIKITVLLSDRMCLYSSHLNSQPIPVYFIKFVMIKTFKANLLMENLISPQPAFTCSKSTMETEQCIKSV